MIDGTKPVLFKGLSVRSTDWEEEEERTSVDLVVNKKSRQIMTIMNHLRTVSQIRPSSPSLLQPLSFRISFFVQLRLRT